MDNGVSKIQQKGGLIGQSPLNNLTFTWDNTSGGATKKMILGDPLALVQNALGIADGSVVTPTINGGVSYATFKSSLQANRLAIVQINYEVTTSKTQFNNSLQECVADVDGSINRQPINLAQAVRNTQFNDKLLTVAYMGILNSFRALVSDINDGEIVTFTLTFGYSENRS